MLKTILSNYGRTEDKSGSGSGSTGHKDRTSPYARADNPGAGQQLHLLADARSRYCFRSLVGMSTVYMTTASTVVWSSGCALASSVFGTIGSGFEPRS